MSGAGDKGCTLGEQIERHRWLIAAFFAVPLLSGIFYLIGDRVSDPEPLQIQTTEVPADIRAYVTGAVVRPGVYPLPEDSRWIDALEAAGGATGEANLEAINLARRVQDEDQIVVPRLGQGVAAGAAQEPLVNINTASEKELESLPGIGEVRAGRIVQSRTRDGLFSSVEELLSRRLVPESVFEDIAPLVTVN